MKTIQRIIMGMVIILGSATFAQAQLGLRVGGILSNQVPVSDVNGQNYKSKIGLDLAAVFAINIGPLALQPEIHFIQKGSTLSDINGVGQESRSTLNYLEVPLLMKINLGTKRTNVHILAGPSIGYLSGGNISIGEIRDDIREAGYNNFEFGAHLGAGARLGSIGVDVRYLVGFSDVPETQLVDRFRNTGWSAGVSLYF